MPAALERRQAGAHVLHLRQQLVVAVEVDERPVADVAALGRGGALGRGELLVERDQLGGSDLLLDLHGRRGRVEQVDRLVGELAAGDIAVRQGDRGDHRLVADRDAVGLFVDLGEPAQHHDRVGLAGLVDLDRLEPALERRVLLEVFLVLGPGGGGDRAQLAARQRRLEQVGRVVARSAAGADQRVRLVDEQDDLPRRGLDLVDHRLEALLELALDAGAGLQRAEVEAQEVDVAQRVGHVAVGDRHGQALDQGALADARLADDDGVVLAAAPEDVDELADLEVAAEDRVDLAGPRRRGERGRETLERLLLGARGRARGGRTARGGGRGQRGLRRGGHDLLEVLLQLAGRDVIELGEALAAVAARAIDELQQQVRAAQAGRAVVQRGDHPGVLDPLKYALAEDGAPGVAGLDPLERLLYALDQRDPPLPEALQDELGVAVGLVEQL